MAAATVATISDVIDQNEKYLQTQRNVSAKAHRHGDITVAFCRKQGSCGNILDTTSTHTTIRYVMTHSFVKTCAGRTSKGNMTRTKRTKPQAKHMMDLNSASSMHARNREIKFNLSARRQQSTAITNLEFRCRISMESLPTNTVGLSFTSTQCQ